MTINLCLIGAGRIGRIHALNVVRHPGARLHAVVDVQAAAAAELAASLGVPAMSLAEVLADPAVDGVIIATSTDTHQDLISAWVTAGKPVLCEKPLDLDSGRARAGRNAAMAAGVPLYTGFNRRFDPSFRRLREALAGGRVGPVEVVSITSRDPAPPPLDYLRRSGGLFRDMTIHDLDMARWLLGEEPVMVFAAASALVDAAIGAAGDVDTAVLVLETAAGRMCQITNSRRCSYGYDQRVEAFGAGGVLRVGNQTETGLEQGGAEGFLSEPALPFFLERYADAYRLQLDHFVRAVSGAEHDLAGADDGVRALLLADAAERSWREGRRVPVEAL